MISTWQYKAEYALYLNCSANVYIVTMVKVYPRSHPLHPTAHEGHMWKSRMHKGREPGTEASDSVCSQSIFMGGLC